MGMSSYAVKKPIPMLMLFLGISIFGIFCVSQLPVELMPNAAFNKITILINIRGGMPPEDVEFMVTKPIEEAVSIVSNLESLGSTSKEGKATIVLSFPPGLDMDFASLEVREKFAKVKNKLPREAEKPVIAKYEENDQPILILAVSSFLEWFSTEEIRKIVDERIKERIGRIPGVANVELSGGRERKYIVDVTLAKVQSYSMPMQKVVSAISRNNLNLAVGDIDRADKDILIRTIGHYNAMDEISDTGVVKTELNGLIRVKDVATVKDDYMDATSHSRTNSKDVVSIYVQKESTANTIKVVESVLKEIKDIEKTLDDHLRIIITSNQATFIQQAIDTVNSSLVFGAILAVIILLLFLRDLRSTLVIAISIPLSVVATFALMYLSHITLNVMSLSGLALGIGMLVDNSIVVLEKIHAVREEEGLDGISASIIGAEREGMAIVASTITTIIVFLPIVFINKQIQILYQGLALTVTYSLIASLFVSLTVVPLLISRGRTHKKTKTSNRVLQGKLPFMIIFRRKYRKVLYFFVQYRYWVVPSILLLVFCSLKVLGTVEQELLGGTESGKFTIFIELPSGAKIELSDKVVKEVESICKEIPEIKTFSSRVEGWSSKVYVDLVPPEERDKEVEEVIEELRPLVKNIGEGERAFIYFSEQSAGGGSKEVLIDVYGFDYEILKKLANEIAGKMQEVEIIQDVKLRMKEGRPEMLMVVDKPAAQMHDLTTREIADELHAQVRGLEATRFHASGGKEIEVVARLRKEDRAKLVDIKKTTVVNKHGQVIPIKSVVDFKDGIGPSEIWRLNKTRMIQVSGSTKSSLDKAINAMREKLEEVDFPKDYYYLFGGDYQKMIENQEQLKFALIVMILLIYMVLASLFENYLQPVLIMVSVPMSVIGIAIGLKWSETTISMGVMIGSIMLGGIVVNNAIIMIDTMNHLRDHQKMSGLRCAITSAVSRLRPILMTTCTTVLGLVPMAFNKSQGSSLWSPLAITVISGMLTSTILTLFILPSFYLIFEDISKLIGKILSFNYKSIFQKTSYAEE